LARSGAKRLVARLVSPELERAVYVWIASLLFIVTCALWQPLAGDWYDHRGIAIVPHVLLLGFAVWLIARAAALLDPLELAGIRPLRAPGPATAASPLMARGPYGVIRHPVYLGWILCVFGVPHMTWTRLSFALISTSYLVIAIPFEERDLTTQFGRNYDSYRRRVRWRVVPFLY
jgi:protein-S-isoprenylcysteine O-methyltransferase Ste14